MPPRIEDYALLGDTHTSALVSREGSIDWLCLPRFDSAAIFAALLGDANNGRWQIAPDESVLALRRRYRGDTLVLETDFDTPEGSIRLVDFMPPRDEAPSVVRFVEGLRGSVRVRMELTVRFEYGRIRPWLRRIDGAHAAIAGPDSVWLRTPVDTREEDFALRADFVITAGERVPFVLTWHPSHEPAPAPIDPLRALADTESFWTEWVSSSVYAGEWREAVVRSLLTLKALTYAPTGAIVAAPTTSLPEWPGGVRNWDYRYCWLRDAAITLLALTRAGFRDEAKAWHAWLLRAIAGDPAEIQAVYGVAGERRLTELELPWLSGYENSTPVRIGNQASGQFQLDLYGEVVNTIHEARRAGLEDNGEVWSLTRALVDFVEAHWHLPDEGLWEVRGPRRHFVSSKVMAWVAVDRALSDAEELGLPARSRAGARCASGSGARSWSTATTRFRAASASRLAPRKSTPPCSCSRSSASSQQTTSACEARWRRSSDSSSKTGSSTGTRPPTRRTRSTGFPKERAPSSPAASGSRRTTRSQDGWTMHARSSSACSRSKTTSVSSPRSTPPAPDGRSATSRRPSATSPSSWSPTSSTKSPSEDAQRKP